MVKKDVVAARLEKLRGYLLPEKVASFFRHPALKFPWQMSGI